jgi:hypothetical protein
MARRNGQVANADVCDVTITNSPRDSPLIDRRTRTNVSLAVLFFVLTNPEQS